MRDMAADLTDYLDTITGSATSLEGVTDGTKGRLPLFLRERYQFRRIGLWGADCLLALDDSRSTPATPAEYAAHAKTMQSEFGEPITLVIPHVASYARNRMVQAGTSFIVPGSQLFMPFMMADLRERFSVPKSEAGLPITPAAQCILLYHLLRQPLQGLPLQRIAKLTGYSAMMLTRVKEEWEINELCTTSRSGRSLVVNFTAQGRQLWHKAEILFRRPNKKSHWIRWERPGPPALLSGYTALSRKSLVEDDPVPTWALHRKTIRAMLDEGVFDLAKGPEEADARLEEWSYDPTLLSDGPCVDPLSLVLCLRGDGDDRVNKQVQPLLDETFTTQP